MAKGRTRRRMALKKQRMAPRQRVVSEDIISEDIIEKPKPKRRPPARKKPGPKPKPKETLSHNDDNNN
jgi:hypothetical protein